MRRKLLLLFFLPVFVVFFAENSAAQTGRKSVAASEVNGTFRSYFDGKFRGSFDEIKILAIGGGKLKVKFDLVYPYVDGTGEMSANTGTIEGIAKIEGDTAIYKSEEFGECVITLKFIKPGTVSVAQQGSDAECGFGHNVSADGTYKKVSGVKPKI